MTIQDLLISPLLTKISLDFVLNRLLCGSWTISQNWHDLWV